MSKADVLAETSEDLMYLSGKGCRTRILGGEFNESGV